MANIDPLLGHIVEDSLHEIFVFGSDTLRFIEVNRGARENLGFSMEELKSMRPVDIKPEFTAARFAEMIEPLRSGSEKILNFQTVHRRKDGSDFNVEIALQLIMDQDPPVFLAMVNDITDRVQLQAHLDDAQRIARFGSWDVDVVNNVVTWSEEAFRIYGYGEERFSPTTEIVETHFHPDDKEEALAFLDACSKPGGPPYDIEYRVVRKDGAVRYLHVVGELVFNEKEEVIRIHGILHDITERKEAEIRLRDNQARLTVAQRVAGFGSWEWNALTNEVHVSDEMLHIMGLEPGEMEPTPNLDELQLVHPEDADVVSDAILRAMQSEEAPYSIDYRIIRRDGQITYVRGEGEGVFDKHGVLLKVRGTVNDISDRKRAEQALRDREAYIRAVIDNAAVAIVTSDDSGIIQTFNPMAEKIFGYQPNEVVGNGLDMLMPGDTSREHNGYMQSYNESGKGAIIGVGSREVTGLHKNGHEIPLELAISEMQTSGGRQFIGNIIDISARKHTERQLRAAQRLEAVGQLTGGVAHDFNNLLMAIQLNLVFPLPFVKSDAEHTEYVESSLHAVGRGAELTQRLLAFSRRQDLRPERVDVSERIREISLLLNRALGGSITVQLRLKDDLWAARVDVGQLENALLNLAINARDAMEGAGKLVIETSNIWLDDDPEFASGKVQAGEYIRVAVQDSGTGMTDDVLARVYEPFFTTKEVGEGSGLGLSMIFGFVKQSDGHIRIESDLGHGTTVSMYFPRAD